MTAAWWAVFWPLLALTVLLEVTVGSLVVAVAVPVRGVLRRDGDWFDVGTTVAAGLLAVAAALTAGAVLAGLGLA